MSAKCQKRTLSDAASMSAKGRPFPEVSTQACQALIGSECFSKGCRARALSPSLHVNVSPSR